MSPWQPAQRAFNTLAASVALPRGAGPGISSVEDTRGGAAGALVASAVQALKQAATKIDAQGARHGGFGCWVLLFMRGAAPSSLDPLGV